MKRAIFIVGPTAVGKSKVAFKISKKIPSVLISADSVQVYRGADIISGKDRSVPTYLLDILSPNQSYSVRGFVESVCPIVEKSENQRKIPIIVGGTGFYIDALFGNMDTISIPPNLKLRTRLKGLGVDKLQAELQKANPERLAKMNQSDISNKRRLIRAIEVARAQVFDSEIAQTRGGRTRRRILPLFKKREALIVGLKSSLENIRKRIADRVEKRLKMGALDEARRLFRHYKNLSSQIKSAAGYKQLFEYLLGKVDFEEAKEKWLAAEVQVAKRQTTYFRRNKNIMWFDIENPDFKGQVLRLVEQNFKI